MTEEKQEVVKPTSAEIVADTSLRTVWDPSVPFPSPQEMLDLDIITQVCVTRAEEGGFHYLHEATIMWHKDRFFACWANHPLKETGDHDELIRGCTSKDGLHWSEPTTWVEAPLLGSTSFNHPLLFSHNGTLYGFFVSWYEEHVPTTELFIYNESTEKWEWQKESSIYQFVPFCTPQLMDDGNWLIGGEAHWADAAVIISEGDDLTKWNMVKVPHPDDMKLLFPESAVVNRGNGNLLIFCRPQQHTKDVPDAWSAPVAESHDCGHTWTTLGLSNYPLAPSQPFAGRLSTGHNYLLTNSYDDGRALLTIALTDASGDGLFRHIFKVRHQQWPKVRLFANSLGKATEWSYPNAFEHEGNLYIINSQGKEDCVLSIIPVECLNV